MNICMLLDAHDYDGDLRLSAEARRLIDDGHRVVVVCDHAADRRRHEVRGGVEIVRLPPDPRFSRFLYRRLQGLGLVLCLFNLRWFLALSKLQRARGFDVFHVHDLPLARTAQLLARWVQRPVVLDLHENYPVLMQSFTSQAESGVSVPGGTAALPPVRRLAERVKRALRAFTLDTGRWQRYEQHAASCADHVIVVVQEARDRIAALGVPVDRITVVGNTLTDGFVCRFSAVTEIPQWAAAYCDRLVIPYFGSLPKFVRIDTLIRSMPQIIHALPNAHLLIVGAIEKRPDCQALAHERGMDDHVTFLKWQPISRIVAYMKVSDIAVLPWEPNGHTNATVSWKMFQYMYAGLPIIASPCAPTERILSRYRCGVVVPDLATDPGKLANALIRLALNADERQAMGRRGREAVLAKYRWPVEGDRLSSLYRSLAAEGGRTPVAWTAVPSPEGLIAS